MSNPISSAACASPKRPLKVDPEIFRPDPHAAFARIRPLAGLIDPGVGLPVVTRHADVAALMTDPRTRQIETETLTRRGLSEGALHDFYASSMLLSNPPAHAHRRAPAARAFAHKAIEAYRPLIRALVGELIEAAAAEEEFEFVEAIAAPLPSRLIARIIGAPEEDAPAFAAMVYAMARGLSAFGPEDLPEIEAAAGGLSQYVERLFDDRRRAPREDFLTDYLRRADAGGRLTARETLMQMVTVLLGASDTTRTALTMLVGELLRRREQWDAVVADPALAAGAALEALRFEPPVAALGRVAIEPLEIDGVAMASGSLFSLSILSAQRDEAVYADPQSFDIRRNDHPRWSVTFGLGPHRCLGEALARAELEEALIALTQRLPGLELRGEPPVARGHGGIRGVTPMRVTVSRR